MKKAGTEHLNDLRKDKDLPTNQIDESKNQPRHAARATRSSGQITRTALLRAASKLFRSKGLSGASVNDIAAEANVFPSQISYYFGSKENLFIEAACQDILHAASAVEFAGKEANVPEEFVRSIVETAKNSPALLTFVEAMILTQKHPEYTPMIAEVFQHLYREGERAVNEMLERHHWELRTSPAVEARAFWVAMLGIALEKAVMGDKFESETAEAVVSLILNLHPSS